MATVKKKTLWSERGQIVTISLVAWALLAFWSLSAFWGHIDALPSGYKLMAKVGAAAGEIILLAFVLWHCFHKKLRVRLWALIFAFVLGASLLLHSGGLRSGESAKVEQFGVNGQVVDALTKMSKEQAAVVGAKPASNATQRERLNIAGKNATAQAEVAKSAQDKAAAAIIEGNEKAKDSSLLPRWYIDQWMYTGMFFLSLALLSILLCIMMFAPGKTDADYDGVPDDEQVAEMTEQEREIEHRVLAAHRANLRPYDPRAWRRDLFPTDGEIRKEWERQTAAYDREQSPSLPQGSARSRENAPRSHFVTRHNARNDASLNHGDASPNASEPYANRGDASPNFSDASQEKRGIELIREALREIAKPGHFSFRAEEKPNGAILIRQAVGAQGREVYPASATFSRNLLDRAHLVSHQKLVSDLRAALVKRGFNLEEVTR
jgi:hypothetical protein